MRSEGRTLVATFDSDGVEIAFIDEGEPAGAPVLLIRNDWELGRLQQEWPKVKFASVRERS